MRTSYDPMYNHIFVSGFLLGGDFARWQHSCPLLPQEQNNMQRTSCPLGVALLSQSLQLWQHDCGSSTPPWSVLPFARELANMLTLHIHITSYNMASTWIYTHSNIYAWPSLSHCSDSCTSFLLCHSLSQRRPLKLSGIMNRREVLETNWVVEPLCKKRPPSRKI